MSLSDEEGRMQAHGKELLGGVVGGGEAGKIGR